MSFYRIEGGRPLSGSLSVQGAKNSVLPILAAAVLAPGQSVIHNCPDLSAVSAPLAILRLLGWRAERLWPAAVPRWWALPLCPLKRTAGAV